MPVSRGHALALSAALHTAGLGVAGWATHGQSRESSGPVEIQAARAYALTFLTLAPPRPRPVPEPRSSRAPARVRPAAAHPPAAPAPSASVPGTTGGPRPAAASQQATGATGLASSPLRTQ